MIEVSQIPHLLLDAFWKPKWKKEALGTLKGGQKFLNYKRDLLEQDRIEEIQSRINDLKDVIRKRDKDNVKEACKQLQGTCEHSLKSYRPPEAIGDNLEVLFVAIAVALGIRAYYVQPFRIPTGSMQPTLNGIIGHQESAPDWQKPNLLVQGWDKVTEGRTYLKAVAPFSGRITAITERRWLWFFTKTDIYIDNAKAATVSGSQTAVLIGLGLGEKMGIMDSLGRPTGRPADYSVKKGDIIVQGYVDTGDLVLVDKFSYHFRTPKRGEVFVFETRGIENIQSEYRNRDQEAGSHYIKRLAGIPGDELRLDAPHLWHNGKLAVEPGFKKVAAKKNGHQGYFNPGTKGNGRYLRTPEETHKIKPDRYFAMGDNSDNSSDSRYWGEIDEYLLVGPGLFALWPFENFGFIR